MERNIDKINAIANVNQEIIDRILSKKGKKVTKKFQYQIFEEKIHEGVRFSLREQAEEELVDDIISRWNGQPIMNQPFDLFSDNIDYSCNSFNDIVRLNNSMRKVCQKYDFLDPTKAKPELDKFKNNFEVLQVCLGKIEEALQHPISKKEEYSQEIAKINQNLIELFQKPDVLHQLKSFIQPEEWMDTSDKLGGFRRSTYNTSVFFAVSKSNVWDNSKVYLPPKGFHWATTAEAEAIFKPSNPNNGAHVYHSQGGWEGYFWNGLERRCFLFADSAQTNKFKHSGNTDPYGVQVGIEPNYFAGIVCIKDFHRK